ncbi:MAG: UDP-glucose/GDP-mannose dehydrogenase family protein [Cytophagia bacterium]|nr:UDP-glucose/GDP-mannose dehydrogenase family protein [Cytophagia bacterium]
MKIAVVGTGYVGLVTGTCFAETGNTVTCVDIDKAKVDKLNAGKITIYEPGLEQLFERNIKQERLFFTTDLKEGIKDAQIIFLALPTPPGEDGSADLKYILKVADDLGPLLKAFTVVVDKSTVPVGTADKVRDRIATNAKVEFSVVSNPEFLREGVAVEDFMKPDRVVIGTSSVRKGIGTDSRIGKRFLFPGIGYGGSCFPKDVQALAKSSKDAAYNFKILNAVMDVNSSQKTKLIAAIKNYFNNSLKGKTIAVWGLAFKPHTDDIREAPALENIEVLLAEGAVVRVHDPEAMEHVKTIFGDKITFCKNPYEAATGADALFIATEWPEFRTPDFAKLSASLKNEAIFDGRNLYDLQQMKELGYTYYSIGRATVNGK